MTGARPQLRILLVEKAGTLGSPVRNDLKGAGHDVTVARSAVDALDLLGRRAWELLVIDCTTIEIDSMGLMQSLGVRAATPVLLLGRLTQHAKPDPSAAVPDTLEPGFSAEALNARVSVLGHGYRQAQPGTFLQVADVVINLRTHLVQRGNRVLDLQPREYRLLEFLVRNAGTVFARTTLLAEVWGYHTDPQTNVVESHISKLRAKIDRGFDVKLIETVRRVGYRFRRPS